MCNSFFSLQLSTFAAKHAIIPTTAAVTTTPPPKIKTTFLFQFGFEMGNPLCTVVSRKHETQFSDWLSSPLAMLEMGNEK